MDEPVQEARLAEILLILKNFQGEFKGKLKLPPPPPKRDTGVFKKRHSDYVMLAESAMKTYSIGTPEVCTWTCLKRDVDEHW